MDKNTRTPIAPLTSMFDFLKRVEQISAEDQEIIGQYVHACSRKRGEILLKEGQIAKELFFITHGILKMISVNEKGRETVHYFFKENQFCTVLHSFENQVPSDISIMTVSDAEFVVFSKENLDRLFHRLPYLKVLFDKMTRQQLLDKVRLKNTYAGQDATQRYRTFITEQADIALRVPLSDAASYLEVTLQSLSRIRRNNNA